MNEINPRVSIIMATYKRNPNYLLRAIKSIENQTYNNTEIVIIDDNPPNSESRKQTANFMEKYKDRPDVIYSMNTKNLGGSLARNNGIKIATGDYTTFLDDDDEYLPNKIEKQLNFMLENDYDMSFTDLKLVNERKKLVDYREYPDINKFDRESLLKYHIMRHLTGTPTFMYKTLKLKEIGGFEQAKIGQEFYLMLKTIEKNLSIGYLNESDVLAYRHNEGGISQGKNKILGEKELYKFKKKYFSILSMREKKFVRFRHYAVMAVAYKRNKEFMKSLYNIALMFLSSPIDSLVETRRFFINIYTKRRMEIE